MKCIRMLTFLPLEQIDEMSTWKDQQLNKAKEILAFELTKMVHGEEEAAKAQEGARALFGSGANTANMPTAQLSAEDFTDGQIAVLDLLLKTGLIPLEGGGPPADPAGRAHCGRRKGHRYQQDLLPG